MRRLLLAIALVALLGQAPSPAPPGSPLPSSDQDLTALTSAIQQAQQATNACGAASCPQIDCASVQAVSEALDDARVAIRMLQSALDSGKAELMGRFQASEAASLKASEANRSLQWARDRSQIAQNTAKLASDAFSLIDGARSLKSAYTALRSTNGPVSTERLLTKLKMMDQLIEEPDGVIGTIDDITTTVGKPGMDQSISNYYMVKGLASDAFGLATDLREKIGAYQAAVKAGASASKLRAAAAGFNGAYKGLSIIIGKLGGMVAESQQQRLQQIIAQNKQSMNQLDASAYANYRQYLRLLSRRELVENLGDFIDATYKTCLACNAECNNSLAPKPVPDISQMHWRQVLQTVNPQIPGITASITAATAKVKITPGIAPSVVVMTKTVEPQGPVSARYYLGKCRATESAEVVLFDASGDRVENLGTAARGVETRLSFTAPKTNETYTVRLIGRDAVIFASDSFKIQGSLDGKVSFDLPAQSFDYYLKHGEVADASDYDYHVTVTASGSGDISRYWASGANCVTIYRNTDLVFVDSHGAPVDPAAIGYTAGEPAGWSTTAHYDRNGYRPGCNGGESAPADAEYLTGVDGDFSWYKAPKHQFTWHLHVKIPKVIPGPYYK